jgi:hypothetical protein
LWRTASSHPEQTKTLKILQNDFTEQRWKTAALKNAFALLGRHRFEYAASFFLLGDSLWDAVTVLVRKVKDIPLAIAVARVYEGDDGPAFKRLIEEIILPYADENSDPWLTSWALWMKRDRQNALSSLAFDPTHAKSFLVDDPVLIALYKYLKVTKHFVNLHVNEFGLVLRTAAIYCRMGCDLLALDLLESWKFTVAPTTELTNGGGGLPIKDASTLLPLLKEKSQTPAPLPMANHINFKPAAAVAFQEPDLSAFDFGF